MDLFWKTQNLPGYDAEQIVEMGEYKSNRKMGLWIKYYANGNVKSEITYRSNRPNGPYKTYYENGQLEESGNWKNNRNIGTFERYHENGQPQQKFVFNSTGKRDGRQEYYYDNGQLMIEGVIKEGKESGAFTSYYENGETKSIKVYNEEGVLIPEESQMHLEPKDPSMLASSNELEVVDESKEAKIEEGATTNTGAEVIAAPSPTTTKSETKPSATPSTNKPKIIPFNGNGEATLYNKDKQISQKGFFKNRKLIDGLYYRYNENGILTHIERYKKGKYVGDAPMGNEQKANKK